MTIQVLVVDDHDLFAEAIGMVLKDAGMNVVASVRSGADAIGFLEDHSADVILLDIGLPDESGLRTGKKILERWPGARIIALSALDDQRAVYEALHIGFHAYVMKDTPLDELVKAIEAAARGETVRLLGSSPGKRLDSALASTSSRLANEMCSACSSRGRMAERSPTGST